LASEVDTSWQEWQQQQQHIDWPALRKWQQQQEQLQEQQQQVEMPFDLQKLVTVPADKEITWDQLNIDKEIGSGAVTKVRPFAVLCLCCLDLPVVSQTPAKERRQKQCHLAVSSQMGQHKHLLCRRRGSM
jgi:hypothetical protein